MFSVSLWYSCDKNELRLFHARPSYYREEYYVCVWDDYDIKMPSFLIITCLLRIPNYFSFFWIWVHHENCDCEWKPQNACWHALYSKLVEFLLTKVYRMGDLINASCNNMPQSSLARKNVHSQNMQLIQGMIFTCMYDSSRSKYNYLFQIKMWKIQRSIHGKNCSQKSATWFIL